MNLESLVISRDAALVGVLRPVLEKIAVNVQTCPDPRAAAVLLAKHKFDAVIVDCDDLPAGVEVLKGVRTSQSNAKSVTFAVLNGKTSTQEAFQSGTNFVLQKPLTPLNATRCFHAALNFMVRERRRYFRHPVEMPVRLVVANHPDVIATSTNLSEGGMSIHCATRLSKDTLVTARFALPHSTITLELKCEVAWTDGAGRAGMRFIAVPQSSQYQLEKWLTERTQNELPERLHEYLSSH